jgi:NAD(P)-dependent dehydrogenase (short-subunit alcohol dehydrogenase family)
MGIELTRCVALVTGAANGIDRATALTFARAGTAVAANHQAITFSRLDQRFRLGQLWK